MSVLKYVLQWELRKYLTFKALKAVLDHINTWFKQRKGKKIPTTKTNKN